MNSASPVNHAPKLNIPEKLCAITTPIAIRIPADAPSCGSPVRSGFRGHSPTRSALATRAKLGSISEMGVAHVARVAVDRNVKSQLDRKRTLPDVPNSGLFNRSRADSPDAVATTRRLALSVTEKRSNVGVETPGTLPARAVDGLREKTLTRRRHQNGQLVETKSGWAMRYYENTDGERLRVRKYLGDFAELPTRRSALNAMQAELAVVNKSVTVGPRTSTTTFRTIAMRWIKDCETRKQKPIKASVSHNWHCILRNHLYPLIGEAPLADVGNRAMRRVVERLAAKKLSPATIRNICLVVKLVKGSAVDDDGNELFPVRWNRRFIDAPEVDSTKQNKLT